MLVREPRRVAHHRGGGGLPPAHALARRCKVAEVEVCVRVCVRVNERKERKFTTELRYIAAHGTDALSAAACTNTCTHTRRLQTVANGKRRPRGTCQLLIGTDHCTRPGTLSTDQVGVRTNMKLLKEFHVCTWNSRMRIGKPENVYRTLGYFRYSTRVLIQFFIRGATFRTGFCGCGILETL